MANITFMIGNGFDLACGLKSRFSDTYDDYINSPSANKVITHFKQNIESDIKTWSDFEMKMAKYAKNFSTENEFIQCVRDYTRFLNAYLKDQEAMFKGVISQSDLRVPIVKEVAELFSSFHKGLIKNDYNQIERMLEGQLNRISIIYFNYTDTLDTLVDLLQNDAPDIPLYEHPMMIEKIVHIHGQLDNDVTLGIDNEAQFENLPYKLTPKGKRVFIKPFFNAQYDTQRVEDAKHTILNSNVICTFGWSLGESDETWRKEILSWALKSEYHHLIVFSHKLLSKQYPVCSITEQMDDAEDYKEVLLNSIASKTTPDDYEKLISRIHIAVGYRVFDLPASVIGYQKAIDSYLQPATDEEIEQLLFGTT